MMHNLGQIDGLVTLSYTPGASQAYYFRSLPLRYMREHQFQQLQSNINRLSSQVREEWRCKYVMQKQFDWWFKKNQGSPPVSEEERQQWETAIRNEKQSKGIKPVVATIKEEKEAVTTKEEKQEDPTEEENETDATQEEDEADTSFQIISMIKNKIKGILGSSTKESRRGTVKQKQWQKDFSKKSESLEEMESLLKSRKMQ